MKKIEAAVGKDDRAAVAFIFRKLQNRLFEGEDRWMQTILSLELGVCLFQEEADSPVKSATER